MGLYECFECDLTFVTDCLLKEHMAANHSRGEMTIHCLFCDSTFNNMRHLNEHNALKHEDQVHPAEVHHCGNIPQFASNATPGLVLSQNFRIMCAMLITTCLSIS